MNKRNKLYYGYSNGVPICVGTLSLVEKHMKNYAKNYKKSTKRNTKVQIIKTCNIAKSNYLRVIYE